MSTFGDNTNYQLRAPLLFHPQHNDWSPDNASLERSVLDGPDVDTTQCQAIESGKTSRRFVKTIFTVQGMGCINCGRTIENNLSHICGILAAASNLVFGNVVVVHRSDKLPREVLADEITTMGFPVTSYTSVAMDSNSTMLPLLHDTFHLSLLLGVRNLESAGTSFRSTPRKVKTQKNIFDKAVEVLQYLPGVEKTVLGDNDMHLIIVYNAAVIGARTILSKLHEADIDVFHPSEVLSIPLLWTSQNNVPNGITRPNPRGRSLTEKSRHTSVNGRFNSLDDVTGGAIKQRASLAVPSLRFPKSQARRGASSLVLRWCFAQETGRNFDVESLKEGQKFVLGNVHRKSVEELEGNINEENRFHQSRSMTSASPDRQETGKLVEDKAPVKKANSVSSGSETEGVTADDRLRNLWMVAFLALMAALLNYVLSRWLSKSIWFAKHSNVNVLGLSVPTAIAIPSLMEAVVVIWLAIFYAQEIFASGFLSIIHAFGNSRDKRTTLSLNSHAFIAFLASFMNSLLSLARLSPAGVYSHYIFFTRSSCILFGALAGVWLRSSSDEKCVTTPVGNLFETYASTTFPNCKKWWEIVERAEELDARANVKKPKTRDFEEITVPNYNEQNTATAKNEISGLETQNSQESSPSQRQDSPDSEQYSMTEVIFGIQIPKSPLATGSGVLWPCVLTLPGVCVRKLDSELLQVGDIVILEKGQVASFDGEKVDEATSYIEEGNIQLCKDTKTSAIKLNDAIAAGSRPLDKPLVARITRIGIASTTGQLLRLLHEVQKATPKRNTFSEIFQGTTASCVLCISAILILGTVILESLVSIATRFQLSNMSQSGSTYQVLSSVFSLHTAFDVLSNSFLPSFGFAASIVIRFSMATCSKFGVSLTSSRLLECASDIKTVIFSKRGVLTKGIAEVSGAALLKCSFQQGRVMQITDEAWKAGMQTRGNDMCRQKSFSEISSSRQTSPYDDVVTPETPSDNLLTVGGVVKGCVAKGCVAKGPRGVSPKTVSWPSPNSASSIEAVQINRNVNCSVSSTNKFGESPITRVEWLPVVKGLGRQGKKQRIGKNEKESCTNVKSGNKCLMFQDEEFRDFVNTNTPRAKPLNIGTEEYMDEEQSEVPLNREPSFDFEDPNNLHIIASRFWWLLGDTFLSVGFRDSSFSSCSPYSCSIPVNSLGPIQDCIMSYCRNLKGIPPLYEPNPLLSTSLDDDPLQEFNYRCQIVERDLGSLVYSVKDDASMFFLPFEHDTDSIMSVSGNLSLQNTTVAVPCTSNTFNSELMCLPNFTSEDRSPTQMSRAFSEYFETHDASKITGEKSERGSKCDVCSASNSSSEFSPFSTEVLRNTPHLSSLKRWSQERELKGHKVVALSVNKFCVGAVSTHDPIQTKYRPIIEILQDMNYDIWMATVEDFFAAQTSASYLGIEGSNVMALATVKDKVELVVRLRREGGVCYVGNSTHDSPALACADFGLIPLNAAGVSQSVAHGILNKNRISSLYPFFIFSQRARTTILRNLILTLLFGLIATIWMAYSRMQSSLSSPDINSHSFQPSLNAIAAHKLLPFLQNFPHATNNAMSNIIGTSNHTTALQKPSSNNYPFPASSPQISQGLSSVRHMMDPNFIYFISAFLAAFAVLISSALGLNIQRPLLRRRSASIKGG